MKQSIADPGRKTKPARRPAIPRADLAIGIDVGDRFSEICVLDRDGAVASQTRLRTTQAALREYFSSHSPARVALETGTHSGWISRLATTWDTRSLLPTLASYARFIRATERTIEPMRRSSRAWSALIHNCSHRSSIVAKKCKPTSPDSSA